MKQLQNIFSFFIKKKNKNKSLSKKNDSKEIDNNNFIIINKRYEIKKKIVKKRYPDIDLIRILGMYAIVFHHVLLHGKALSKYYKYKKLHLANIYSYWHVCSFALVSGIVGYKTNKYSNLLYIWLWALFYSVGVFLACKKFKPQVVKYSRFYMRFFPIISNKNWYLSKYFGLYLFLPVINKGISVLTKIEFQLLISSILCIYIIWNDLFNPGVDVFTNFFGYSVLSLLMFYLVGAYIGKYRIKFHGIINKIIVCLFCIFVYFSSSLLCYKLRYKDKIKSKILLKVKLLYTMRINSVPMISQAFSIIFFSMQLKYNKYIAKLISFIGPLTFGIYLIHENQFIRDIFIKTLFIKDSMKLSCKSVVKLALIRASKIFVICFMIDYVRHLLFCLLRIRKLCIFIEKSIYKIFEKFFN